jgi:hypothetical protein
MAGKKDPQHLLQAIRAGRVLFSHNHDDFQLLHELVLGAGGRHPGVLIVRRDNDPTRDLKPQQIVGALRKLLAAGVPIVNEFNILNHWR